MNRLMLFILLFASMPLFAEEKLSDIDQLRWQNRVIIVLANHLDDGIDTTFALNTREIIDRDIVWFIFHGDKTLTNFTGIISEDFKQNTVQRFLNMDRGVLLFSKDGHMRSVLPSLNLNSLFNTIDAMPMRQQELQSRV